jgi:kynurenine 3-monooxygenase
LTFFRSHFPDAIPLVPGLVDEFQRNRTAEFITTYTFPWQHKGRIVLLGDACHSVVPFYGQGMNAAFEDCVVLSGCIARNGDNWEAAFEEFEQLRKRNTDALAGLSKENFLVLCNKAKSTAFMARKKVELGLNRLMPRVWVPLYTMVTHTTMPYADAVARAQKQERIARFLGIDLVVGLLAALIVITKMLKAGTGVAARQVSPYITRLGLVGQNVPAKDAAAPKSPGNS